MEEIAPVGKTEKVPSASDKFDAAERHFLREIDKMQSEGVGELTKRWMDQYEHLLETNADDKALMGLFLKFGEFLEKRENALFSLELPDDLTPELFKRFKQFDRNVIQSFKNPSLFLGNGATAEVFEMAGYPDTCIKFITNQERYNENNHMRSEFNYLNLMRSLRFENVRTPAPYFLRIHPKEGHSYGMEKIDGKSLSQILERPEDCRDLVELSKKLNREEVANQLSGFVSLMHEHDITHNDLRLRNIMLDRAGKFFVIDFGKAKKDEKEEAREMHRNEDFIVLKEEIRRFFDVIDKLNI